MGIGVKKTGDRGAGVVEAWCGIYVEAGGSGERHFHGGQRSCKPTISRWLGRESETAEGLFWGGRRRAGVAKPGCGVSVEAGESGGGVSIEAGGVADRRFLDW